MSPPQQESRVQKRTCTCQVLLERIDQSLTSSHKDFEVGRLSHKFRPMEIEEFSSAKGNISPQKVDHYGFIQFFPVRLLPLCIYKHNQKCACWVCSTTKGEGMLLEQSLCLPFLRFLHIQPAQRRPTSSVSLVLC